MAHQDQHGLDHEDHPDILIASLVDGQILKYESASGKWKNVSEGALDCARMYNSAIQNFTSGGWATVAYNNSQYDTNSFVNPPKFDIPENGVYHIVAGLGFTYHATGYRVLAMRLNGSTIIAIKTQNALNSGSAQTNMILSTDYKLSNGDYIEMRVYQNSGSQLSNVVGVGGTWAAIHRVGDG